MKQKLINNVYDMRTQLGVTQQELAKAVGVTRQTIISIERGNYTPSVLLALRISRYFKKPIEEIFKIKI